MNEVTRLLDSISEGDPHAADQLLPLVYAELRRLAARKLAHERPGQTLDATCLVHEAYLRLAGDRDKPGATQQFANRRHFFAAAAKAMGRILIDRARKRRLKQVIVELDHLPARLPDDQLLELDPILDSLARTDATAADLVRLHLFAGMSIEDAGATLRMSRATAFRNWAFARAWLRQALPEKS
jgi:RNA polymerase sigma factor (TIGR02999 family)